MTPRALRATRCALSSSNSTLFDEKNKKKFTFKVKKCKKMARSKVANIAGTLAVRTHTSILQRNSNAKVDSLAWTSRTGIRTPAYARRNRRGIAYRRVTVPVLAETRRIRTTFPVSGEASNPNGSGLKRSCVWSKRSLKRLGLFDIWADPATSRQGNCRQSFLRRVSIPISNFRLELSHDVVILQLLQQRKVSTLIQKLWTEA